MLAALVWLAVVVLIVVGLVILARSSRPMTDEEYEARRGKGRGVGNALLAFQEILEPGRGDVKKAQEVRREESDPGGDPPEPGDEDSPGGEGPPERDGDQGGGPRSS